jgi:hypothetical protein
MSVLAATRPTDWDFPLFLHILGATILVGGLVTTVALQVLAWRKRKPADVTALGRWGFWALLTVALPGWVLTRLGGQWIYSKEGWSGEDDPSWLGIGFMVADIGFPVLVVTIVFAGVAMRRGSQGLGRVATLLVAIMLIAYLVAVWAMTAKPD